jgi:S-adenosylmethionine:tRNA ribosyltransferase-isomerase
VDPARLFGRKETGGQLILVERVLDARRVLAHAGPASRLKVGSRTSLLRASGCRMVARHDALFELAFDEDVLALV